VKQAIQRKKTSISRTWSGAAARRRYGMGFEARQAVISFFFFQGGFDFERRAIIRDRLSRRPSFSWVSARGSIARALLGQARGPGRRRRDLFHLA